jgi:transcriptional regulator with XRE-family HTH domain
MLDIYRSHGYTYYVYRCQALSASRERDPKNVGYTVDTMPRKVDPTSEFGRRLLKLRIERGLTQAQLAEAIDSTQRAISHYETVADYPPPAVIVALAKALKVSTDELLGIKKQKPPKEPAEVRKLQRKFRQVLSLPEKDRRAIMRMINSLVAAQQR